MGDSPDIGRVSKMRPGFDPRTLDETDRGGSSGRRRSSSSGRLPELKAAKKKILIALGSVTVVIALGVATWMVALQKGAIASKNSTNSSTSKPFAEEDKDIPPPSEHRLIKNAEQMVQAKRPTDLPEIVRLGGKKPEALLAKLEEMAKIDGEVANISYIGPVQNLTQPLEGVLVSFRNKRNRIALFSPDKDGQWQIDFDSYSRAASTPWEQLLSGGDVEGTVRVYVSLDSYYNGRFGDESQWSCNGMASPDQPTLLFGYAAKNSPADRAIQAALDFKVGKVGNLAPKDRVINEASINPNSRMLRMTLAIKHREGDDKRQFEITRVIADDWATPVKALDERY